MAAPKTRNWSANESAHRPKGLHLLVRGEVEVSTLNKLPQLTKTDSRDPKVLGLTLTIVADPDEPSGDAVVWRCAAYHEVVKKDQYASVVIRWEGDVIERIAVVDDREHAAHMAKQCAEQNAAAAKTIKLKPASKKAAAAKPAPKEAAAKKAAPKKAAPTKAAAKKKAPKAVGGWAKKAKKKTGKKVAKKSAKKKSAKKSATKSALNKFVRKMVKKFIPKKKKKR